MRYTFPDVIICKLDKQILANKFDCLWLFHNSGIVSMIILIFDYISSN